jgi:hypothetical protein
MQDSWMDRKRRRSRARTGPSTRHDDDQRPALTIEVLESSSDWFPIRVRIGDDITNTSSKAVKDATSGLTNALDGLVK